jgi:hypothetical protein
MNNPGAAWRFLFWVIAALTLVFWRSSGHPWVDTITYAVKYGVDFDQVHIDASS